MTLETEDLDFIAKAEGYENLGPNYFAGQAIAEKFMAQFKTEHFTPLIETARDEFYSKLLESLEYYLLSNAESNIQGEIWRRIDRSVLALMSGEAWAIERYAMQKYDGEAVRAAVAKHVPKEIQDARIADLEKEVERLKTDLKYARREY